MLIKWNPVTHTQLVTLHAQGKSPDYLSDYFSIPLNTILDILALPEATRLQTTIVASIGYNSAAKRAMLIERMIDAKIEDSDVLSDKDLSTLMRLAIENARCDAPKDKQPTIQIDQSTNTYTNLLEKIYSLEGAT